MSDSARLLEEARAEYETAHRIGATYTALSTLTLGHLIVELQRLQEDGQRLREALKETLRVTTKPRGIARRDFDFFAVQAVRELARDALAGSTAAREEET